MGRVTLEEVTGDICEQLALLLVDSQLAPAELGPGTRLIDDLGLDSLKFVDLTLALEERFGLREFPMQEWVDLEAVKKPPAFTVHALALACLSEMERANGGDDGSP